MPISNLSSAQLQKLVSLVREKQSLQAKLAKVEAALAQLDGAPAAKPSGPVKRRYRKRARQSGTTLKDSILQVLSSAGPNGLNVKEIASQAKAKAGSVSVWIYTTGKKIPGLKKVAPGKYAYSKG